MAVRHVQRRRAVGRLACGTGERRTVGSFRSLRAIVCAATIVTAAAVLSTPVGGVSRRAGTQPDVARYILPPGNYGGLPTTDESRDQLPLYDALTPLRGNVTDADIQRNYLPEDFQPIGTTQEIATGRPGLRLIYDEYGVPHIYGQTREDVAFGAGWVTARDRLLLLQFGRYPARVAVADVPNIDAFSLVTSLQTFVPSAETEALVSKQVQLLVDTYGAKGREILADAQAEADGANAYLRANNIAMEPFTVNDIISVTAFIGSIFGAGGGGEARNADFLAKLQNAFGPERGRQAWEDAMLFNDPEAPTTLQRRFDYGPLTGGRVRGSVVLDANSIESLDPRQPTAAATADQTAQNATVDVGAAPPRREASNWLLVNPRRSATGNTLGVMGPQLGYYYPEIVEQVHIKGPGYEAQGIGVPGLMMYVLIGRTHDYAWSLTSAGHDVRDVFVEKLCEPDGSAPTRASDHYLFHGECRPFQEFFAGTLNGVPLRYPTSVHGAVIGTATVNGGPVALTRQRSTFGRDALNLAALKDMTDGVASTPKNFFHVADQFGFTFNWAYASRTDTAYFTSGRLPVRAHGLDRRLPTLGTGEYEWKGFLREREHPHGVRGSDGLLLNWNNQAAPGFMHGDDNPYGSVHRVELFDKFPRDVTLADDVSVMNRAATEDTRSPVWPVVSEVLRTGPAPSALDARALTVLDEWISRDAPRLDADQDGKNDDAGAVIMDAVWRPIAEAVMRPVYGDLLGELNGVRNLNGLAGESFVDKDLRTLLGERHVRGPFHLRYCGNGSLDACRASLWAAFDQAINTLASAQGPDPAAWRGDASRTGFAPGLIPDAFRTTNRPTFQQVLELVRPCGERDNEWWRPRRSSSAGGTSTRHHQCAYR
jgi:acyl-homoserine lactone acylase PvdQ